MAAAAQALVNHRIQVSATKGEQLVVERQFQASKDNWVTVSKYLTSDLRKVPDKAGEWAKQVPTLFIHTPTPAAVLPAPSVCACHCPPCKLGRHCCDTLQGCYFQSTLTQAASEGDCLAMDAAQNADGQHHGSTVNTGTVEQPEVNEYGSPSGIEPTLENGGLGEGGNPDPETILPSIY